MPRVQRSGLARAQVRPDQTPYTPTFHPHPHSLWRLVHLRPQGHTDNKQAGIRNNNTFTLPPPSHHIHIKHKMPSQWNTDGRICRLPMPRIPRLGAKARDAGVYVAGGLVNTTMIAVQRPKSNERPMDSETLGVLHFHNGLSIAPVSPLDEHNTKSRRKQKSRETKGTQRKSHQK